MKKILVNLNLKGKSESEKVMYAYSITTLSTGNIHFPNAAPLLPPILAAANALKVAIEQAEGGDVAKVESKKARETELDELLTNYSHYVQANAQNSAEAILSTGLGVKSAKSSSQPPLAPQALIVKIGNSEGEVVLRWKAVKNKLVYVIEQSEEQRDQSFSVWHLSEIVTKNSYVFKGLTSGTNYAFRVYCISAGGKSANSTPALIKAW